MPSVYAINTLAYLKHSGFALMGRCSLGTGRGDFAFSVLNPPRFDLLVLLIPQGFSKVETSSSHRRHQGYLNLREVGQGATFLVASS